MTLFFKDQPLKQSYAYGGYLIIKQIKQNKTNKISFYESINVLEKGGIEGYKQQFFCLMFLYACGIINFSEPYFNLIKNDN